MTPPSLHDDWWLSAQVTRRFRPQLRADIPTPRKQHCTADPTHVLRKAFPNLRCVIRWPPSRVLCLYGFTTSHHAEPKFEKHEGSTHSLTFQDPFLTPTGYSSHSSTFWFNGIFMFTGSLSFVQWTTLSELVTCTDFSGWENITFSFGFRLWFWWKELENWKAVSWMSFGDCLQHLRQLILNPLIFPPPNMFICFLVDKSQDNGHFFGRKYLYKVFLEVICGWNC